MICRRCLYPSTRPDTHFVDGLCSGCRSFDERRLVNWKERVEALTNLVEGAKREAKKRGVEWDVLVPVSGGKDSTYQVLMMLGLGARVLAVNAETDYPSALGQRNLANLERFAPVLRLGPSREVRRKLVRIGLFQVGDMSWPEHCAIWSIPSRVAQETGVPLVVWGEQPQREYACPEGVQPATRLDGKWVAEFGGLLGLRIDDVIGEEGLTEEDVALLRFPDLDGSTLAVWLGDYLPWDGWRNAFVAQQYGFETYPFAVETSLGNYENLDNHVTILRDWLRFLKYGYSRATDIANNHIRRGRLLRAEAAVLVEMAERFPKTSLGMPIEDVLREFSLSVDDFVGEADKWTNPEIFIFDDGKPRKDPDGTPRRK